MQPPISSKNILHEGLKMKIFSEKGRQREFVTSRPIIRNVQRKLSKKRNYKGKKKNLERTGKKKEHGMQKYGLNRIE